MYRCSPRLKESWDLVGVDEEDCDDYLDEAYHTIPDLRYNDREDVFEGALEDRARCTARGQSWCGTESPLHKLSGEYTITEDVRRISDEEDLTVTQTLLSSSFAKDRIEETVKSVIPTSSLPHLHTVRTGRTVDDEGLPTEIIHNLYHCGYLSFRHSRDEDACQWVGRLSRKIGDRSNLYLQIKDPESGELKNRTIKIGKELQKAMQKEPENEYHKMLWREITGMKLPAKGDIKLIYQISTDPIDVAQKSTNQRWHSCEAIGGEYDKGVFSDIANWNAVAYIHIGKVSDKPQGRIMLRHCMTEDEDIGVSAEGVAYGSLSTGIVKRHIESIINQVNPEYLAWDVCSTPYYYHGYSDTKRGPGQIHYGERGDIDVIDFDSWIEDLFPPEEDEEEYWEPEEEMTWGDWLAEYNRSAVIIDYAAESFHDLYDEVNLRDYLEPYVEGAEVAGVNPEHVTLDEMMPEEVGLGNVYDITKYRQYENYVRFMGVLLKAHDYKHGIVVNPSKTDYSVDYDAGKVFYIASNDPDSFVLTNWMERIYTNDNRVFDEFLECIQEGEGQTKKLRLDVSRVGDTDRVEDVEYHPSSIPGCLNEHFGFEPLNEFIERGETRRDPEWKRAAGGLYKSLNTLKAYEICTKSKRTISFCDDILADEGLLPEHVDLEYLDGLDVNEIERTVKQSFMEQSTKLTDFT